MRSTRKATISIRRDLLKRCDAVARRRGVSRSALVSEAVERLVRRFEDDEVTRTYNELAAELNKEFELVRGVVYASARRILERDSW